MRDRSFFFVAGILLAAGLLASRVRPAVVPPAAIRDSHAALLAGLVAEKRNLEDAIRLGCSSVWLRHSYVPENSLARRPDLSPTVPPAPLTAKGGSRSASASTLTLSDQLDSAVVLVLGKNSIGTGFFITSNLIVTDRHVVEGATRDGVFVTNHSMGKVVRAQVIERSDSDNVMAPDFAVLRIATAASNTRILKIANNPERLTSVVAAGFPGAIVETDAALPALLRGDASKAPQTVFTQGVVSVVQPQPSGFGLVIHTVEISTGNSGGPLVYRCARVVGVNRFVRQANRADSKILYSLGADALTDYLKSHQVLFEVAERTCNAGGGGLL